MCVHRPFIGGARFGLSGTASVERFDPTNFERELAIAHATSIRIPKGGLGAIRDAARANGATALFELGR